MKPSLLPISLVCGFLGAGKTTFMRHLLRDAKDRGLKIGVVINEFGVADIDGPILRESGAELLGSLAGGCACCSSQDEMIWTMLELGRLAPEKRPDAVLLEASGLADPLVMLDGLTVAPLLPLVGVASVTAVVDALRLPELQDNAGQITPLLARQIGLADLIIANKSDLAFRGTSESAKNEAESTLRTLNSAARIEFARDGAIDLDAFWKRVLHSQPFIAAPGKHEALHGQAQTLILPMSRPVMREKLENALRSLDRDVWRVKGFVRLAGENDLFLLQFAAPSRQFSIERFEFDTLNPWPPAELVFIGPAIDEGTLRRDFGQSAPML